MARQWIIPGFGFINESGGANEHIVPGFGFLNEVPTANILSVAASGVGIDEATINGTLANMMGEATVDCYFQYREVGAEEWTATSAQELSEVGAFNEVLSSLDGSTNYEFRAVLSYGEGPTLEYGETLSFYTLSAPSASVGGLFFCHG